MLRKTCKLSDSISKGICELRFNRSANYEHVKMKSLMSVDQVPQVSDTDSMICPWVLAVNKTARTKDSDLLEFLKFKCL